jgi:hypothetical protein
VPSAACSAGPPHEPRRQGRLNITPTAIAATAMPIAASASRNTGRNDANVIGSSGQVAARPPSATRATVLRSTNAPPAPRTMK